MIITHVTSHPELWAALKAPPVLVSKDNVMVGYNPIYEYAALPDVPRIVDAIWHTVSIDQARGGPVVEVAAAAPKPSHHELEPRISSANSGSPSLQKAPAVSADFVVTVPIMGEGLRTARVVSINKQPGDPVQHDDVLCEVETDKAVYPIEASFAGRFKEWKIKLDDTVLIGQEIALVSSDPVSPKLPSSSSPAKTATVSSVISSHITPTPYVTKKVTVRPPALNPAITKRLATVVPATMLRDVRWDALRAAREDAKKKHGKAAASPSAMMAWCVIRAQEKHAAFRCLVHKDGTILEQADFDFGVAVALDGDRLATAPIAAANKLGWTDFVNAYNRGRRRTRGREN